MHPKDIDILHLEPSILEVGDDPTKGTRCISAREDVFVHEEAPNKVFVLPRGTDTGDLENEDAVVVEEVVNLAKEGTIAADTDVLDKAHQQYIWVRQWRQ
jgi:hypothetical protein